MGNDGLGWDMMEFEIFGNGYRLSYGTATGERNENQDRFAMVISSESGTRIITPDRDVMEDGHSEGFVLLSVCDGMGGMRDGAIASRIISDGLEEWALKEPPSDEKGLRESLYEALAAMESRLMAGYPDSGTTFAAVIGTGQGWYTAHIGDSRCYLVTDKGGWRTFDHSHVEKLHVKGAITEDEMNHHPLSNLVSRYLGGGHANSLEMHGIPEEWTSLIVCTDGAFGYMSPDDFWELAFSDMDSDGMVEKAFDKGGKDDTTVLRMDLVR